MSTVTRLPPLPLSSFNEHYAPITSRDEVIHADWGYAYDLFDSYDPDPDMRVRPEWVGKRAGEVCPSSWEYFYRPVLDYAI